MPATTFEQWVAWAKANRGRLSYANYGPGTISHFLGHQLDERFGLGFTQVPYRGNAPQMIDLLAGHALFGFTQLQSAVEPARAGSLRALVVSGAKRSPLLPEVPTLAEVGLGDMTAGVWFGLLLKAGTPADVVQRLEAAAIAAHADAAVKAKLAAQGFEVSGAHRRRLRAEHRPAVRALGEDREGDGIFRGGVGPVWCPCERSERNARPAPPRHDRFASHRVRPEGRAIRGTGRCHLYCAGRNFTVTVR